MPNMIQTKSKDRKSIQTKRIVVAFRLAGEPGRQKLGGVLRYIAEHELKWQLHFIRIREDFSAELVRSFPERRIDGIIFSLPSAREDIAELAKLDIPTIAADIYDESPFKGRKRNLVFIAGSTDATGRIAARHFLSQGLYKSYGYVPDLQGNLWSKLRGDAFIDEMKRNGFPVAHYRVRCKGYDLPHLASWIKSQPKPLGIFAAFDDRAIQVLEACHEAQVDIPHDVAVIGVDNDEMLCTNTTPTLTSIQPDNEQLGYLAAERLAAMMGGHDLKQTERIHVSVKTIVIRESTSPVSSSGRLIQRALAFIRNNATKAIKPRDVAVFLKVSRSLADLRFRELQGESIGDVIRHYRLEEVRHRLLSTNDTIENIAAECAFSKLSRLNKAFREAYGCTMKEYRRRV